MEGLVVHKDVVALGIIGDIVLDLCHHVLRLDALDLGDPYL
jgi:hypothetical protein